MNQKSRISIRIHNKFQCLARKGQAKCSGSATKATPPHHATALILLGLASSILLGTCAATPGILLGSVTPSPSSQPDTDPWANQTGWHLAWNDEFASIGVDNTKWVFETGGGGWGNNELEYYQPANATIASVDGTSGLVITAKQENIGGSAYTSARLTTQGKASWSNGRIEARLKLPYGQGIWPAFWMLGTAISSGSPWPTCGEIDIM